MAIDLNEQYKQAQKEKEGDFYTLKEGANRMRILTEFEKVESIYRNKKFCGFVSTFNQPTKEDKPSWKGWAWAIIRGTDGDELKIIQLTKTALNHIASLKNDPEYAFDCFPMPYDITLNAKNAGTTDVEYSVVPARKNTEVTEAEIATLNKKKKIPEIVARIIAKQDEKKGRGESTVEYPSAEDEGINPEDVKF